MEKVNPVWGAVDLHISTKDKFGSVSFKIGSTSPLYIRKGFLERLMPDSGCLDLLFLIDFVVVVGALLDTVGNLMSSLLISLFLVAAVLPDAPPLRGN